MLQKIILWGLFGLQILFFSKGFGNIAQILVGIKFMQHDEMFQSKELYEELKGNAKASVRFFALAVSIAVFMFLFIQWGYL